MFMNDEHYVAKPLLLKDDDMIQMKFKTFDD